MGYVAEVSLALILAALFAPYGERLREVCRSFFLSNQLIIFAAPRPVSTRRRAKNPRMRSTRRYRRRRKRN
jgi:hypothetical protein